MYRSNRSFNIPSPLPPPLGHTPGIWHLCRPGVEGISLSESSRGNLIPMRTGWGILTVTSISREIPERFAFTALHVGSYHGRRGVRVFSWKRLCLCGQLAVFKGIQILILLILDSGSGYMHECIKLC